ncbi:uncharacterized protein [Castor canadensis]|uniref:Uncharacterized protein n=1 Tax=Castor canadensis TaxID=51338 RepID=A0AC58LKJ0_CASCN
MYVPGHQSAKTPEAVGNNRADQEARRAAMVSPSMVAAIDVPVPELPSLPPRPEYSSEDFTWMRAHSLTRKREDEWRSDLEGKLILPEKVGRFLLANLHKSTHLGRRKLLDLLTSAQLRFPNQTAAVHQIVEDCASCTAMKPGRREGHHTGRWNCTMGTPLPCETGTSSGGAGKLDCTTASHKSTQALADTGCSKKRKHPRCSAALLEWDHHLGPLHPHQTGRSGSCEGRLPANKKGVPPQGQFLQTQTSANWTSVTLFLFLTLSTTCLGHTNPHQPFNLTWMIVDVSTGDILNQTSKVTPPSTWFPELYFDLRALFTGRGQWDLCQSYFYVCPAPQPNHRKNVEESQTIIVSHGVVRAQGTYGGHPPNRGTLFS